MKIIIKSYLSLEDLVYARKRSGVDLKSLVLWQGQGHRSGVQSRSGERRKNNMKIGTVYYFLRNIWDMEMKCSPLNRETNAQKSSYMHKK